MEGGIIKQKYLNPYHNNFGGCVKSLLMSADPQTNTLRYSKSLRGYDQTYKNHNNIDKAFSRPPTAPLGLKPGKIIGSSLPLGQLHIAKSPKNMDADGIVKKIL